MAETARRKKKQQHGTLLLRRGVVDAVRMRGARLPSRSGEEGAPLTPVPTWKLYENPSYQSLSLAAAGAVASVTGLMEQEDEESNEEEEGEGEGEGEKRRVHRDGIREAVCEDTIVESAPRFPAISARKLVASLWEELQEGGQEDEHSTICDFSEGWGQEDAHSRICDFSEASPRSHLQRRPASLSTSESPDSIKHQHSDKVPAVSQLISRTSHSASSLSPPLKAIMLMKPSAAGIASRLQSSGSKVLNSSGRDAQEGLGELSSKYEGSDITSSCDYVEASCRSQALEKTQMESSLVAESSFGEELKRALSKVQQVEAAQISARKEVDVLLRRCADEILMLRAKEQEKMQATVLTIAEQLDKERKAKRNVEMENRRLASSLADANKAVLAAKEELDKERKARQLMEDVCDELAKEIGEDKTEAQELKRELAKVRHEIEEERKHLQVTEAWREERVQMKLSEARLELEERCVALDSLKMELELFLKMGKAGRADTCLDRGGENLRGAVEKLQGETNGSLFFCNDARGFLSPGIDAISSDNSHPCRQSWGSNNDQSTMHMNLYDGISNQQTLHPAEQDHDDFGWNVESDRSAKEEYNCAVSRKAHVDELDKYWIRSRHASRRKAAMKSYGRKVSGLNSSDGRGLAEDAFNDLEYTSRAESNSSGIEGNYMSEYKFSNEEEGTDFNYENAHLTPRDIVVHSASEEEESRWRFLPKHGGKGTSRMLQTMDAKWSHGGSRVDRRHRGKSSTRIEQCYDKDSQRKYAHSQQTKHHTPFTEDGNGFASLTGYSPAYKGHAPSPDLVAQKGITRNKQRALRGRKTVYCSVDWSKPYKRNSLQAKLLLEDGLSRGDFDLMN